MIDFEFHGHRVRATEAGREDAPLVVLHNGLMLSGESWHREGYVDALAGSHRVVALDPLGHGESDIVTDDSLHTRSARAEVVVAAVDHLGVDRFHFVGYSMGGWVGGALARRHADRLASLSIGAWDPERGFATAQDWTRAAFGIDPTFDLLHQVVASSIPDVGQAPPEKIEGWRRSYEALEADTPDDLEVLGSLGVPVQLWCGRDDMYADAMAAAAQQLGITMDLVDGDHVGAFRQPAAREAVAGFVSRSS